MNADEILEEVLKDYNQLRYQSNQKDVYELSRQIQCLTNALVKRINKELEGKKDKSWNE